MPVSKKRKLKNGRKPVRKVKGFLDSIFMPQCRIDEIKSTFSQVELIAEVKLGTGGCTFDDVAKIRDVINACAWCATYKSSISKDLSDEWVEANWDIFLAGQEAFGTFYARGNLKGGIDDDSVRYVCTGEEFVKIRDAIAVAGDLCQQMLDKTPLTFNKLFSGMKTYVADMGVGKKEFDGDSLLKAMRRI